MKKKILKSFTFYFMLLSLLMIFMHYKGHDSHGITLFHLNLILRSLLYSEFANKVIRTGPKIVCGSVAGEIYIYWYVAHFISFVIYGLILDFLKYGIRKLSKVST
jgi:hypothetical protein